MIRVLIVDDSAFMRKAIEIILTKDPEITVVGQAGDGKEALEAIDKFDPDVVTMDVEMPRMDGITAVREIMARKPKPVLMISSVTTEGAETTLRALDAGAMDFISKPASRVSLDMVLLEREIQEKVKAVSKRRPPYRPKPRAAAPSASAAPARPAVDPGARYGLLTRPSAAAPSPGQVVAAQVVQKPVGRPVRDLVSIGVSTGGPPAVQKVLSALPADFPVPILIAQHMPAAFTPPFANRLNNACEITVKEAVSGEKLLPGVAYVAPGGRHIYMEAKLSNMTVIVTDNPKEALYKPSANVLHESVGKALGRRALGVQLTGMGSDGLEGIRVLKEKGGRALAQSDATCVVYGMPKAIVDAGLADEVVDIDDMALAIMNSLYKY
ncbi:fused chemotaxis regulator; protein-glutamate methylesterase in two-component regulatory system with CheA [uncultured delta proteobacterium]|uniref:Protein-glutamate methylesterase/protein-glutamine glutaminase n=1 Tax=uncultured delta proteobacterium TaxID=34034 RepID=A0A212J0K3_9DELT|nr:fused chemotaxis regulator; protein-glutamate methylesterase in two-component regulatory system with CheA [uncultured delta proteobacterium]